MGLLSPLDEKFSATVSERYRAEIETVREIAWTEGAGLSFHARRELQFVVTSIWLDYRLRRDALQIIAPKASQGVVARLKDQAKRIGQRLTDEQRLCLEMATQELGQELDRRTVS